LASVKIDSGSVDQFGTDDSIGCRCLIREIGVDRMGISRGALDDIGAVGCMPC